MHWRQLLLRYLWCFHSDSSTLFLSQNTKLTPDDMIGVDMEMFCSKPDPNPPSPASNPNLTQTTISTMPSGDTTWCRTLRISHPPQSELICWWYNPLHVLARDGIKMTFFGPTNQPASQRGKSPRLQWATQQLKRARRSSSGWARSWKSSGELWFRLRNQVEVGCCTLCSAQTTNISFPLARNSTKCGSGSAHIWHLHHTPVYKRPILGTEKHMAKIIFFGHFLLRLSRNDHSRVISKANFCWVHSILGAKLWKQKW